MNTNKNKVSAMMVIAVAILFIASTSAFATLIDFTNLAFSGGSGLTTFDYTYTEASGDVTITFDALGAGSTLWWDSIDGLGVQGSSGYEIDEIDSSEALKISFSKPMMLSQFHVTDLFMENNTTELGFYSINGGAGYMFGATVDNSPGNNGDLSVSGLSIFGINDITFYAPPFQGHEFSVADVDVIPNPEPGTLLLLGSGLLGFGIYQRKSSKK